SDPLKTARADGFDPKEFFAETLGDAKLLGVVRLVDIVEFVLTAADIRMPTIVQELEHLIGDDVVRAVVPPILAGIESTVRPALDKLKNGDSAAAARLSARVDDLVVALRLVLAAANDPARPSLIARA